MNNHDNGAAVKSMPTAAPAPSEKVTLERMNTGAVTFANMRLKEMSFVWQPTQEEVLPPGCACLEVLFARGHWRVKKALKARRPVAAE